MLSPTAEELRLAPEAEELRLAPGAETGSGG